MAKANPFIPPGKDYGAVDTESRLRALEEFNLEQCHAALEVLGLQATVEKKLRIRIRALEKLAIATEQADGVQVEREVFKQWHLRKFGLVVDEGIAGACQERWEAWQARAALAQTSPAPELKCPEVVGYACLDDIQWGGDITLRPEKSEYYSVPFAPAAQAGQVPSVCDGKEQDAFEAWAAGQKMDMSCHPLHWLFLNEKTYSARQGWKAALEYVGTQIVAAPVQGE